MRQQPLRAIGNRALAGRAAVWLVAALAASAQAAEPAGDATATLSLLAPSDLGLRADLAWLVDRGVLELPLGTWPLPSSTLRAAWRDVDPARLAPADADALDRVRRALLRSTATVRLAAQGNSARHPSLDGGDEAKGLASGSLNFYAGAAQWGGQLALGTTAETLSPGGPQGNLNGSYLTVQAANTVVAAGVVDRWWGPGQFTSPLLSTAAPPIAGAIVRRAVDSAPESPLLAWIGRWGYEISAGRLAHYDPQGTRTIGLRLYTRPLPNVEVGIGRAILWAGQGRAHDWVAFRSALLGRSNVDDPSTQGDDPSDEISGLDLRVAGADPWGGVCVGYLHLVGEDEAGGLPTKLFGTVGVQRKAVIGQQRIEATFEATDTMPAQLFGLDQATQPPAYVHAVYVDGYYQGRLPIGAAIGGGGTLYSLGLAWTPIDHPGQLRVSGMVYGGRMSDMGAQTINAAYGVTAKLTGLKLGIDGETAAGLKWQLGVSVQRYPGSGRPTTGIQLGIDVPLVRAP